MPAVWIAVDDLGYDGQIIVGAAADAATGRDMCQSFMDSPLEDWAEDGEGNWSAKVIGLSNRYTVTRYEVQAPASATP